VNFYTIQVTSEWVRNIPGDHGNAVSETLQRGRNAQGTVFPACEKDFSVSE
jgi:hypothetical protein